MVPLSCFKPLKQVVQLLAARAPARLKKIVWALGRRCRAEAVERLPVSMYEIYIHVLYRSVFYLLLSVLCRLKPVIDM